MIINVIIKMLFKFSIKILRHFLIFLLWCMGCGIHKLIFCIYENKCLVTNEI